MCIRITERPLESLREHFLLLLSSRARTRSRTFPRTFHPIRLLRARWVCARMTPPLLCPSEFEEFALDAIDYRNECAVPLGRTIQAKCVILPDHFSSRSLYRSATDLIYVPQVPSHRDVTLLLRQCYSNFINVTFYLTHTYSLYLFLY